MELPSFAVLDDPISPPSSGNCGTEDQGQFFEGSTPALTTSVAGGQLVTATIGTTSVTTTLVPPSVIPTECIPTMSVTDLC